MSSLRRRSSAARRAAVRWLRRALHVLLRIARVVLLAGAAAGPAPPPPEPPAPAPIVMMADAADVKDQGA
jgi:hypothetical protein